MRHEQMSSGTRRARWRNGERARCALERHCRFPASNLARPAMWSAGPMPRTTGLRCRWAGPAWTCRVFAMRRRWFMRSSRRLSVSSRTARRSAAFFWDGRATSLAGQGEQPFVTPFEMASEVFQQPVKEVLRKSRGLPQVLSLRHVHPIRPSWNLGFRPVSRLPPALTAGERTCWTYWTYWTVIVSFMFGCMPQKIL